MKKSESGIWRLPTAPLVVLIGLAGLIITFVSLTVITLDLFLLYVTATNITEVTFNYGYSMLIMGVVAFFSIWLVARPLFKIGIGFCNAALKTTMLYITAHNNPEKARLQIERTITKKRSRR